jgi:hypothetical protein
LNINFKSIKMKKLILSVVSVLSSFSLHSNTTCECGDYQSGRTIYQVGDGEECCSGTAQESGFFVRYEQSEGIWKAVEATVIRGITAQSKCCRVSS